MCLEHSERNEACHERDAESDVKLELDACLGATPEERIDSQLKWYDDSGQLEETTSVGTSLDTIAPLLETIKLTATY